MKNKLYNENERDKIVIVVHQMGHILYACVTFMNFWANQFFRFWLALILYDSIAAFFPPFIFI